MAVKPRDFKSLVSTNFTTRAVRSRILSRPALGQPGAAKRSSEAPGGEPLLETQGVQGVGFNHPEAAPADIDQGFEAPANPSGVIEPGAARLGARRALTPAAQIAKAPRQFGIEDAGA